MTPVLLIISGIALIGITIWDIRRKEADMLFWIDLWWNVNKTDNPILYRMAVAGQIFVAFAMLAAGLVWLIYFQ